MFEFNYIINLLNLRKYNKLSCKVQYPREFGVLKQACSKNISLQCKNLA